MAKIGTITVSAAVTPTCTPTSVPSSVNENEDFVVSVKITNNAAVTLDFKLGVSIGKSGFTKNKETSKVSIGSGSSKELSVIFKAYELCADTYDISGWTVNAYYGTTEYSGVCSGTFTLTSKAVYVGKLESGHVLPSVVYLGKSASFTIKGKNTNRCRTESMYAKVICKYAADETKSFAFTSSAKNVSANTSTSFTCSGTVPTNIPVGTYNVYAELYAGAST